ncbi:MAG TPA: hypothetical protein VGR71_16470, partial [Nitrospira sp.]|nr:hypothetical protein [Nitrospira sp.]
DDFTGFNFNDAVFIPQKSKNAVQLAGLDVEKEMVFVASDGSIKTVTEKQYFDQDYDGNPLGYFSQWRGVLGNEPGSGFSKCIGGKFWFMGNGLCNLTAYDDNLNPYVLTGPLSPFLLTPGKRIRADIPMLDVPAESMRWAVGFDNKGVAGAYWEAFMSTLYKIDTWDSLPG